MSARARSPGLGWIFTERTNLLTDVNTRIAALPGQIGTVWGAGSSQREAVLTCTSSVTREMGIVAELQGMTKPEGWRLRANWPSNGRIVRDAATAGSTEAAAGAILRWVTRWHAAYQSQPVAPSIETLEGSARADMIASTQRVAVRLRDLLTHRLGLRKPGIDDLILGLDAMAARHLAADEVDDLLFAVRKLLTQTVPLEGQDCETLCEILDISPEWMIAGTGHSPLP